MPDSQTPDGNANGFYIVGIGASAGGVQALERFFANVPNNSNAAFVVIQHLSPNHRSMMEEILQRQTTMRVRQVEDQMPLEPGTVYILQPRKTLTIRDRHIHLEDKSDPFDCPINRFFESLVEGWNEHIIAILLSGTGKDGTEGLQAVSRVGGVALVQSPETAEFTSMPSSAIPSGLVDEVLSPEDLARTVFDLIRFSENFPTSQHSQASQINRNQLETILEILADREDIDFSHYKTGTLSRRIHHRCALTRHPNLDDYIRLLERSEEEQKRLRQDLLIGATAFFRDPPAWDYIEQQVLPELINNLQPDQQLRIWVSACATGEEAYTMAILVDEALQRAEKSVPVKIFATDLDSNSLEVAAQGIYPERIASEVSPERLERYFIHEEGQYRVKRSLRETLIIAPHDLTKNAGFSKMNLVSCRNVLIYMQPQLQGQVLRLLHFALAPKGVLLLGSSESLGSLESEFEALNPQCKIFRKRRDAQPPMLSMTRQPVVVPTRSSSRVRNQQNPSNRLVGGAFKYCLADRQITCLLVDQDNQLVRVFYNAAQLLEFPVGDAVLDVTEIVHPALQLPLSTALHRAKRDRETVLYSGIKIDHHGEAQQVSLRVGLDKSNPSDSAYLFIVLEVEAAAPESTPSAQQFDVGGEAAQQINELEYELQQTRENLQIIIEELETTNEEQQATNEELLASNEELQSTNEELQSVNEELYTVNAEYQTKIKELTQLNNDIDNLLRSTDIGVVFLDGDLNIRKFTPAATEAINIKPTDIGRPIADLTINLDCDNLLEVLQAVVNRAQPIEQEVRLIETGENRLMRVNPYLRDGQHDYDGVVLTLININDLKQAQARLQHANKTLENLYATTPVGLCLMDSDLRFVQINQTLADINGAAAEEHIGKPLGEMLPRLMERLRPHLSQVLESGISIYQLEVRGTTSQQPEKERVWLASYYPVDLFNGERGIGAVVVEVTERVEAEAALRDSEAKLQEAQRLAKLGNWELDLADCDDLQRAVPYWSPELFEIAGFDPQQPPPTLVEFLEYLHPGDRRPLQQSFEQLVTSGTPYELDVRFQRPDGEMRHFNLLGETFTEAQGQITQLYGAVMDITARKSIQERLIRQNQALEEAMAVAQAADSANQAKSEFLSNMSHEIRTPLNAILGGSQLLERSELTDQQQRLSKMISSNGRVLIKLIDDILNLSKLEARQLDLEEREFSLGVLISHLRSTFEPQAAAKDLTLGFTVDPNVPERLLGDDFRLQQVLSNLLSNAIKFTASGEVETTVAMASDTQDADSVVLRFCVRDTGIGIDASQQNDIFQPFVQADGSTTRQYGGTGLGLAICRRIIEMMGGHIGLQSHPGAGSRFWFTLPLRRTDAIATTAADPRLGSEAPQSLQNLKILVVEDRPQNLDLLILMLETLGIQASWAEDGEQALERLAAERFDLVLMDCQMPVLDGYEATHRLRQREANGQHHTIVIGVTAHAMPDDRDKCLAAGMDDYLSKPISLDGLTTTLERWMA